MAGSVLAVASTEQITGDDLQATPARIACSVLAIASTEQATFDDLPDLHHSKRSRRAAGSLSPVRTGAVRRSALSGGRREHTVEHQTGPRAGIQGVVLDVTGT